MVCLISYSYAHYAPPFLCERKCWYSFARLFSIPLTYYGALWLAHLGGRILLYAYSSLHLKLFPNSSNTHTQIKEISYYLRLPGSTESYGSSIYGPHFSRLGHKFVGETLGLQLTVRTSNSVCWSKIFAEQIICLQRNIFPLHQDSRMFADARGLGAKTLERVLATQEQADLGTRISETRENVTSLPGPGALSCPE